MRADVEMKCTHFVFQRLESLFPQPLSESLSAPVPLLQRVLCQRVSPEDAVSLHHAQSGASTAGHTGEALAAWETEHRHLVKAHVALRAWKLGPPQDGPNWLC